MAHTIKDSGDLPRLNLPLQKIILKKDRNHLKIFDPIRKKYIVLTPEEYVRQQFVSWLRKDLNYPQSIIANEIGFELNGTKRRCDTVVFDSTGSRIMIVEYKAPEISITQSTFDQIVRYNLVLQARYLVVTNGMDLYCCHINYTDNTYIFLQNVPDYKDII